MTTHAEAVEAAITAAGDRLTDTDRPLVELARALAAQVDATGEAGPGTRLAGTYLTTLRTLRARTGDAAAPKKSKLTGLRSVPKPSAS